LFLLFIWFIGFNPFGASLRNFTFGRKINNYNYFWNYIMTFLERKTGPQMRTYATIHRRIDNIIERVRSAYGHNTE